MPGTPKPPLSVVIMTRNEEENLPRCLESVAGLWDELLILDSFSTDRTLEIARSYNARIEQHAFGTFYEQRRRLISMAKYDRILLLDADEWLSPELRQSVMETFSGPLCDAYRLNRLSRIGHTWIRHGSWYPDRKYRYFDRRKIEHTDDDPHDRIEPAPGAGTGRLKGDLLHQADKDLGDRFKAAERYSTRAAASFHKRGKKPAWWRILLKPGIRFLISYVLRRGFLDGYYGWIIAKSEAQYVFMREVKLWEMEGAGG